MRNGLHVVHVREVLTALLDGPNSGPRSKDTAILYYGLATAASCKEPIAILTDSKCKIDDDIRWLPLVRDVDDEYWTVVVILEQKEKEKASHTASDSEAKAASSDSSEEEGDEGDDEVPLLGGKMSNRMGRPKMAGAGRKRLTENEKEVARRERKQKKQMQTNLIIRWLEDKYKNNALINEIREAEDKKASLLLEDVRAWVRAVVRVVDSNKVVGKVDEKSEFHPVQGKRIPAVTIAAFLDRSVGWVTNCRDAYKLMKSKRHNLMVIRLLTEKPEAWYGVLSFLNALREA